MIADNERASEFWEPWTPTVGQRVRVRLSGECDRWGPAVLSRMRSRVVWEGPHPPALDGHTAVVEEADPTYCDDGHWVYVRLDDYALLPGVGLITRVALAASELIPLAEEEEQP